MNRTNVDYNLAKQLKEAGYPQDFDDNSHCRGLLYDKDGDIVQHEVGGEYIYIPTLSELIEACGDGFCGLTKFNSEERNWRASWDNGTTKRWIDIVDSWGNTKEEVVANLW